MTRKLSQWDRVAAALAVTRPIGNFSKVEENLALVDWKRIVLHVADALGADKAKFDRVRFLTASSYFERVS